jgi:hypothetical protein
MVYHHVAFLRAYDDFGSNLAHSSALLVITAVDASEAILHYLFDDLSGLWTQSLQKTSDRTSSIQIILFEIDE